MTAADYCTEHESKLNFAGGNSAVTRRARRCDNVEARYGPAQQRGCKPAIAARQRERHYEYSPPIRSGLPRASQMTVRPILSRLSRPLGLLLVVLLAAWLGQQWALRNVLPGLTKVVIAEANLPFEARLDTGAEVSSINALDIEVVGGEGRPTRRDIGRKVRFTLVNDTGAQQRLEAQIAEIHGIRTADCREWRYHVYLNVAFRGETRRVLMNLNDRSTSAEKLLLGRNWLAQGFSVHADDS